MGRYDVRQKDDFVDHMPLPGPTHSVVITDKSTGQEYKGSSSTVEKAEEKAWEKVREDQKK